MNAARRARLDGILAGAVVAIATMLYPRALLRGESFFDRDLVVDWYQRQLVLARCLREGAWPVWDPTVGFGYPLLADPGAQVLYPPAWAAFALPLGAGYSFFVVAHLLLGAIGMRRLASALGAGRLGAFAAGCFWAASGPIQSALNLRHHLAGSAWLPWVLLATERAVVAPGRASLLGLAAVLTLQFLAGSPELVMMTGLLAAGWAGVRLLAVRRPWSGRRRTALTLVAAAFLSAGLAAAQWWPTLDVLSRSPRRNLPAEVRVFWSVPVTGLVRTVAPLDQTRVPFAADAWTRLFDGPEPSFLWSIYLGGSALLLGFVALAGRSRRTTALASFAVLAAAFAMGPHAPVYGWATTLLPVLRTMRYPVKALLVVSPMVALLLGLGLSRVARGRLGRCTSLGMAAAGLALGLAGFLAARGDAPPGSWMLGPALTVATGLLLGLPALGVARPRLIAASLAALSVCDLVVAHRDLNATAPAAAFLRTPGTVALVERAEHRRLYVYNYHSLRGTSERLLGRHNPYQLARPSSPAEEALLGSQTATTYLLAPAGGLYGLENSYDYDLRGLGGSDLNDLTVFLRLVEGSPLQVKLLRMGAVSTVLSLHRGGFEGLDLRQLVPGVFADPIHVWRVPGALPRSWVVGCAEQADLGPAFEALAAPAFDPARQVILADGPAGGDCGPAGSSHVVSLLADRMRLEVDAARPGWVVTADAYERGWQARLDGRPVPLHRADIAFRAVAVPQGRHQVELVYRPRSLRLGLALSLSSLLAMGVVVGWGCARSARPS